MTAHPMPIDVFVREGLLQEINRRVLHPIGLALSAPTDHDGEHRALIVVDYRDDPEGVRFAEDHDLEPLARKVRELEESRRPDRVARLGYFVQPATDDDEADAPAPQSLEDVQRDAWSQLLAIMRTSPDHQARVAAASVVMSVQPEP